MEKKSLLLIRRWAAVRLQVPADVKNSRGKLVFVLAVATLPVFYANARTHFVGPVVEQITGAACAIRIVGKYRRIRISFAHVIQVVGVGEAVQYFKTQIDTVVESVFNTNTKRDGHAYGAVLLPVGVSGIALTFRAEWAQKIFLVAQIRIRIIVKQADANCHIRCEGIIRIAGHEAVKVEIALQRQLPDLCIETQVAAQHELVVGIVFVGITQLRKSAADAERNVVAEVFAKKNVRGKLGGIQLGLCIQITEVVRRTQAHAKLTFLDKTILCAQPARYGYQ